MDKRDRNFALAVIIPFLIMMLFAFSEQGWCAQYVSYYAAGDSTGSNWANARGRASLQTAEAATNRSAGNDTLWISGGVFSVANYDMDATENGTNKIVFIHATAAVPNKIQLRFIIDIFSAFSMEQK